MSGMLPSGDRNRFRVDATTATLVKPIGTWYALNMGLIEKLKVAGERLRSEVAALRMAARDPRTPWYAKLLVAAVVAYACSPVDLIPDFIPILGYLDDIVLIPLGITLALKLVPPQVLAECRARARDTASDKTPVSRIAGAVIVALWLTVAALVIMGVCHACLVRP